MAPSLNTRGAAHDLRHLLCTIRLTAEMLEASGDATQLKRAQRILRAVDRGTDICTQFVAPEGLPNPTRIKVADLLHDVRGQLVIPAGIDVDVQCQAGLVVSQLETPLFRAVQNLASNAIDAMSRQGCGRLCLRARELDERLVLTVEDTGPGLGSVPQGTRAWGGAPASAGLGLKTVRSLIDTMGGDLKVLRTGPLGTSFGLILPDCGSGPETTAEGSGQALDDLRRKIERAAKSTALPKSFAPELSCQLRFRD